MLIFKPGIGDLNVNKVVSAQMVWYLLGFVCFLFLLFYLFVYKASSTSNVGLEFMMLQSRVACSTDLASQASLVSSC